MHAVEDPGSPATDVETPPSRHVVLTEPVADYLLQMLNSVHLHVAVDNFAEQAAMIIAAKAQLKGAE